MPAAFGNLQVPNQYTRERIQQIIESESAELSDKYLVSIIDSRDGDLWELWIERPCGDKVSMPLHADLGELTPAIIRIRLRELIKLL